MWFKISLHSSVQCWEVQSGRSIISSCSRATGIGVGAWWACGDKERNNCGLFLYRASARALCLPGRCSATKVHWNCADKKAKHRRRWADCSILLVWLLMAATIAVLSKSARTPDPNHWASSPYSCC